MGNLRFVCGIIIVSFVFMFTVPAMSEANELDVLTAELSEKEAEIVGVLEDIRQVHFELSELNVVVDANDEMIEALNAEIDTYKAEIEELEQSIAALRESIRQRDEILKTRLSTYQANGGNATFIEVIFSATTFADFISRFTAVTQITSADADLIQRQLDDKAKVEEAQLVLKDKLAEQRQLRKEYVDSNRVVLEQKQQLIDLEASLLEKEDILAAERDQLQGESAEMIAAIEATVREEIDKNENTESIMVVEQDESQVEGNNDSVNKSDSRGNNNNDDANTSDSGNKGEPTESDLVTSNNGSSSTSNGNSKPKEEAKPKPQETKPKPQEETKPKEEKPKPQEETKPKEEKPTTQVGTSVITIAHQQLGVRYVYGDMKPGVSFDCSGYVSWVFQQAGAIPNVRYTTGGFAGMGTKVSMENAQPGDLVFFKTTGAANSHVGIYLGNNQFIGAQTSTGVAIASMNNSYWKKAFDDNGQHVRRIN